MKENINTQINKIFPQTTEHKGSLVNFIKNHISKQTFFLVLRGKDNTRINKQEI